MTYGQPIFGTVTSPAPEAVTTTGRVRGENRDGVAIFRGIPYGDDTASRRFLPPVPAKKWDGVRDCTKNGDICWQYGGSISGYIPLFNGGEPEKFGIADEKMSENCLQLNVLTPGIDDKKRPVLVYIHGGGFANGTGTLVLGADKYVREQDQVLVGINHRLNVFGYLYLGAFSDEYKSSGMAGALDLVLALEWVRDNIAAFGGDPDQVTIMGESGGGSKVSHLLAFDCAKDLFRAAIVESGSIPIGTMSREAATDITKTVMNHLGISDWKDLLTVDPEKLLSATKELSGIRLLPIPDDIYLTHNPEGVHLSPAVSADKPVAIGCSTEEMAGFVPRETLCQTDESLRHDLLTPGAMGLPLKGAGRALCTEKNVDRVMAEAEALARPGDNAIHRYQKILSVSALGGNSIQHALVVSADEKRTAPTYAYLMEKEQEMVNCGVYCGHTNDLPLQLRVVLFPECEELSKKLANFSGAFVRSGNPSANGIEWPAFDPEKQLTMIFDDECRVEKHPLMPLYEAWKDR